MSETKRRSYPEGQPSPDLTAEERDAFIRAKIERALEEAKDRSNMIPAEKVWQELGLEP